MANTSSNLSGDYGFCKASCTTVWQHHTGMHIGMHHTEQQLSAAWQRDAHISHTLGEQCSLTAVLCIIHQFAGLLLRVLSN